MEQPAERPIAQRARIVRFTATVEARPRGGVTIRLPFDPSAEWGTRYRHDVTGSIGGYPVRGTIASTEGTHLLQLGPAWCRDPRVGAGYRVEVVLGPEGPQLATMAPDVAEAFAAAPEARRFFESLATFYRKGHIDWIESAKRPDTRAKRIAATIVALEAGQRHR